MLPTPRPELMRMPQVAHGSLDYAELAGLGLDPDRVLDFSANINPHGPSPGVTKALAGVPVHRYPDREALALRRALAAHLGASPEQVIVGNGSTELLWLVALAFVRAGDPEVVVEPTFGEYARALALMGAAVYRPTTRPDRDFQVPLDEVAGDLRRSRPRLLFLCNPNNPTGVLLPSDSVLAWARDCPETLFVVDESYLAFASGARSVLDGAHENVLVLRSMTKDYALAGLRLGYAVGHPEVVAALARARPPWSVSALAQAAGIAALEDQAHLLRSLKLLAEAKRALVEGLGHLGLEPVPSAANFFLVRVGSGATLRSALLQRGILVRDCASFGLPAYIRIATRRTEENGRLLSAVAEVGL